MAHTTLEEQSLRDLTARLRVANEAVARHYPGEAGTRQPVHTVYGGAHIFKSDTTRKLGELALKSLAQYAPGATAFAEAIGIDPGLAETVFARVQEKLRREAVEDFRIDFEDGYGIRADAEEDGHAAQAAQQCAKGRDQGTLSPFIGIRIKSFAGELAGRSLRTLDIFLSALGKLPQNFVVTLPKITSPEQVSALIDAFEQLEPKLGLVRGSLKMEPMIEVTQAILDPDGVSMLPQLLKAARGRMVAAHFGTYDYTASCNITAAYQSMRHPACDFAKQMMMVAYAGTGIFLSDGATTTMPVPVRRSSSFSASACITLAMPTSTILTHSSPPFLPRRMLAGLRSRWTMPWLCASERASSTWEVICRERFRSSFPPQAVSSCASVLSPPNSITRKSSPEGSWPKLKIFTRW